MARRTLVTCDRCGAEMSTFNPAKRIEYYPQEQRGKRHIVNSIDFTFNISPCQGETHNEYCPDLCPECINFFLEQLGFVTSYTDSKGDRDGS